MVWKSYFPSLSILQFLIILLQILWNFSLCVWFICYLFRFTFPIKIFSKIGLIILHIQISEFTRGKNPEISHLCRFCISTSLCSKFAWQIVWRYNSSLSYLHLCCSPCRSLAPCANFEIFHSRAYPHSAKCSIRVAQWTGGGLTDYLSYLRNRSGSWWALSQSKFSVDWCYLIATFTMFWNLSINL